MLRIKKFRPNKRFSSTQKMKKMHPTISWKSIMITIILTTIQTTPVHNNELRIRREVKGTCISSYKFCELEDFFQNPLRTPGFCLERNADCVANQTTASSCEECKCKEGYESFVSYTYGCLEYEKAKFFLSRGIFFFST